MSGDLPIDGKEMYQLYEKGEFVDISAVKMPTDLFFHKKIRSTCK